MLKSTISFYLKSLKFIFIPLVLSLIGLGVFIGVTYLGVKVTTSELEVGVESLAANLSLDANGLLDYIVEAAKELMSDGISTAIDKVVNQGWLNNKISDFMGMTDSSIYAADVKGIIDNSVDGLRIYITIGFIVLALCLFLGYFLASYFIRKEHADRSLSKVILVTIVDTVLSFTLVAFVTWLVGLLVKNIFYASLISFLLYGFISIFEAYLAHKKKRTKFEKVVNLNNVVMLLLSDLVVIGITIAAAMLLILVPYQILSLLLIYSIIVIAVVVIKLSPENYVSNL